MDYGKNLKLARKWANVTQKQLAEKAGIAAITIHQYEAGKRKPTMENWFAIANALHLSLDELNDAELLPTGPFNPETVLEDVKADEDRDIRELQRLLIHSFSKLNMDGKHEAVKRTEELTEIPRYRAETAPQSPPAPQEGQSTTPPPDAPETPSEGE